MGRKKCLIKKINFTVFAVIIVMLVSSNCFVLENIKAEYKDGVMDPFFSITNESESIQFDSLVSISHP